MGWGARLGYESWVAPAARDAGRRGGPLGEGLGKSG